MKSLSTSPAFRALEIELQSINDQLDDLFWTYTRTARGKPPVLVRPDLYQRRAEIEAAMLALRLMRHPGQPVRAFGSRRVVRRVERRPTVQKPK